MDYERRFKFLICAPAFDAEDLEGQRLGEIITEIERIGFAVVKARKPDDAEEGNQLWTCPGHNGGMFYARSPIGRIFVDHLGEALFRDDLDNSVVELGDLLVHEGPALAAQRAAAKVFGAERTYFVLNGTSMSNKVVLQALVAAGDLVLFDRNNHKAAHHGALFLGGAHPVQAPA